MPKNTRGPCYLTEPSNFCTARNAHACGNGRVITNLNVVRHLNEVIKLHAIAKPCVGKSTTIDGCIGAHLNIIAKLH